MSDQQRVFSGVQPSGRLHLGNYVGALTQWVKLQHEYACVFCVVDWHALTIPEAVKPQDLLRKTREVAALYLACGIDPERSVVFRQSDVKQHPELTWILNCVTPLGWLERMTQFKTKSAQRETVGTGLLNYPVLQAADILLYDTHWVPVGEDQKQHVEITRDIAQRFNSLFQPVFVLPEVMLPKVAARLMAFDDPAVKMSKSLAETNPRHAISLLDTPQSIRKTIMSAVTDSGSELRSENASPGVRNLLTLLSALTGEDRDAITHRLQGQGYGYLKREVLDAVMATLEPIQQRYREIAGDPATVDALLTRNADRIRPTAEATMQRVREAVGVR
ncbi:tryptophan--tRNA ligase [Myxococcota bacterium]